MASAHIEVTSTVSRLSADVRRTVDAARSLQEDFQKVKDIMDQVALGGDYAALGVKLNLTAAEAETVYALWGSANTEMHATFITQLVSRLG
jgi:hypothetical protein